MNIIINSDLIWLMITVLWSSINNKSNIYNSILDTEKKLQTNCEIH